MSALPHSPITSLNCCCCKPSDHRCISFVIKLLLCSHPPLYNQCPPPAAPPACASCLRLLACASCLRLLLLLLFHLPLSSSALQLVTFVLGRHCLERPLLPLHCARHRAPALLALCDDKLVIVVWVRSQTAGGLVVEPHLQRRLIVIPPEPLVVKLLVVAPRQREPRVLLDVVGV